MTLPPYSSREASHAAGQLQFFSTLAGLQAPEAFAAYLDPLRRSEWVVYAKRPFAGPTQVLAYLARYTHRVAISNRRLVSMEGDRVSCLVYEINPARVRGKQVIGHGDWILFHTS